MEPERGRRARVRSFLLGGALGAAASLAAVRRSQPRKRRRPTPGGLAAFEGAPCYREIVEREEAP